MSELVRALLEINWSRNKNSIIKFIIVPYVLYLCLTLQYLIYAVLRTPDEDAQWPHFAGILLF